MRGYGFEIEMNNMNNLPINKVSVPLRGYGFEIVVEVQYSYVDARAFPSPCGDMVLKFRSWRTERLFVRAGFRPLAGIWF